MTGSTLRLRRFAADTFVILALVAVLMAGTGAVLTYDAHVGDQTTTEVRQTALYETDAAFTHGATVTRENEVFPVGTRLTDRSQYYTEIAPIVDGNYTFGYRAGSGTLDTEISTSLVVRGVAAESGAVLWEQRRPIDSVTASGLTPSETAVVDYRVNVSQLNEWTARITDSLGGTAGEVQTFVRVTTQVDGQVAGTTVERTTTDRLAIATTDGTYSLTPNTTATPQTIRQSVAVQTSPGPLRAVGGPLLLLTGLLGGGALVVGRTRGLLSVSDHERQLLTYQEARSEYDEWITTGTVPASVRSDPSEHVVVDDLEGLVDVAIDTDGRVIEDATTGRFFVETPGRIYRYNPPEEDTAAVELESAVRRID